MVNCYLVNLAGNLLFFVFHVLAVKRLDMFNTSFQDLTSLLFKGLLLLLVEYATFTLYYAILR